MKFVKAMAAGLVLVFVGCAASDSGDGEEVSRSQEAVVSTADVLGFESTSLDCLGGSIGRELGGEPGSGLACTRRKRLCAALERDHRFARHGSGSRHARRPAGSACDLG